MRICLFRPAYPLAWSIHYEHAFRAVAEVITVGPSVSTDWLTDVNRSQCASLFTPNDITASLDAGAILTSLLPPGWTPDLIVAVSELGTRYRVDCSAYGCPRVYISIDSWHSVVDYLDAVYYDFVFVAQREFVDHFRRAGCAQVFWLPMACDPAVHHPMPVSPRHDISFVGTASLPAHLVRYRMLQALSKHFSVLTREALYGKAYCAAMALGRMTFNCAGVRDVNMRIFEALAAGCPLLTNRGPEVNGLLDLFKDGKHLVVYDDEDDLIEKARTYLADDDARIALAKAGRREVLARHTYRHRVQAILKVVRATLPQPASPHPPEIASATAGIPRPLGITVDMGGVFPDPKALSARGLRKYIPLSSMDELTSLSEPVDTIAFGNTVVARYGVDACMTAAWARLGRGGALLVALDNETVDNAGLVRNADALFRWVLERDFIVIGLYESDSRRTVVARKRTDTLQRLFESILANLPDQQHTPLEFIAQLEPRR